MQLLSYIHDLVDTVRDTRKASMVLDAPLVLNTRGLPEEEAVRDLFFLFSLLILVTQFFSYAFSPVIDEEGQVTFPACTFRPQYH